MARGFGEEFTGVKAPGNLTDSDEEAGSAEKQSAPGSTTAPSIGLNLVGFDRPSATGYAPVALVPTEKLWYSGINRSANRSTTGALVRSFISLPRWHVFNHYRLDAIVSVMGQRRTVHHNNIKLD